LVEHFRKGFLQLESLLDLGLYGLLDYLAVLADRILFAKFDFGDNREAVARRCRGKYALDA
jgi:hypothetical protein